jgi:DNA-3-methyladenine glycosylase II
MIMTDHPGWILADDADAYRAFDIDGTATLVTATITANGTVVDAGENDMDVVEVDPAALSGPDDLITALTELGVVARVRNSSLWDAISAALMRQVIRAGTARTRYRRFCAAYGEPVTRAGLTAHLFPRPEQLLELSDSDFADLGAGFHRDALRSAARSYLTDGERWRTLPPIELTTALQTVPRIGAWTSKTAVADWNNDFSFYDYSDIAVQPAARALSPSRVWPEGVPAFKAAWEETAKPLSEWTILTLTWGINHGQRNRTSTS